ncbi:AAA family ATPase [Dactylosporangium sp. CA-139066]|uniref:AAA family ATPase n=1 Tax=Dactylosporangium sp. CA-139066 TaxID=3239930 RepID=UPI003D89C34D
MSTTDAGFVGRGPELAALAGRLGTDAGGVVLVEGPAGVGKTALVDHALRRAGAAPVRGHCPAEPAPPLWPWRAALRRVGLEVAGEADVEPGAAASARFAALARMGDALLAAGPAVVVLEDLHWADAASLDLLHQIAPGAADAGLTLIGTVRSPAPEEAALRLAALARYGAVTVALAPFTVDEVAELVDPAAAADVYARTAGLPLLVSAVRAGHGAGDLPTVVRTLLAALSTGQRAVIEAAAVLGEEVDDAPLAAALAEAGTAPPGAVADGLSAAWHAGLLVAAGHGGGYRFAHALVRDGIVARLEPAARRRLARSAALALEAGGDDHAARVAALWRQAGLDAGSRRAAAAWSRTAAAQARAAHAYDDAAGHLADALADLSNVDTGPAARAELLIELGWAQYRAGRYDRCLEHCAAAADAADEAGRGDLVAAAALVLQGVTFAQAGSVITRLCHRALAYPGLADGLRARVLAQLAVMTAISGRVGEAEAPARESIALATASGDPHAEIDAARARELTLRQADAGERLRLGDLVVDRAEALGQPLAALIGHEWRMQAAYLAGRLDVVESAAAAIEEVADRSPLPVLRWHRHRVLASRAALAGRFPDAARHNHRALAIAQASGDPTAVGMHFAHGVHVAVLRGDPAALPDGYAEAVEAAPPSPLIDVGRANALALTGALPEAREVYDGLRTLLSAPADHPAWVAIPMQLVDLVERFDDAAAAEMAYRQLLPFRESPGAIGTPTAFFHGTVSRHLGQFAAVFGDTAGAIALLREARERNRAVGARPDTALTCLALARLLRGRGGPDLPEAARLAHEALDIATRLGMPGPASAAGRLAAGIAEDRDGADPLTAREREIAALLAEALTNRQIAARLVLSERTIESHVRSILAKTRCANRTEFVARWSASQP